jgi:hypothetical protein
MFMPPKSKPKIGERLTAGHSALSLVADSIVAYGVEMASTRAMSLMLAKDRPDLKWRYFHRSFRPGDWNEPL